MGRWLRALLRGGVLVGSACVSGAVGAAFLVFAGYAALRASLSPAYAALVIGGVLLVLAISLAVLAARVPIRQGREVPAVPSRAARPTDELVTLSVFTIAFVLGRRLTDSGRD